ncbi:SpaH/EbpB family LPXTG-anchored major pilin [Galactobacter sp.]|uniref:SpaH/EbpB family LPXTG-anchored major pilin n=1 Tax=Galactobacter sp. TaxID=2676125 RepID=UPI0025BEDB3D|nr:SpaH/EbpB family LPXTG-anchored major pilin [Galactobacter sp.]
MKNAKFGLGRRLAVVLGALALTATGAAGAANAADVSAGNIDPDQATTLTIHKHSGTQGKAGDGTPQNITNPALAGVTFSIQKVESKNGAAIDLDTAAGWDLISGVKAEDVTASPSAYKLGTAVTDETDSNGEISKTLDHGLYLVTETDAPANVVSKAAPFLVTLPLSQNNGSWLYDVHVYPKNQLQDKPEKTVSEPTAPVLGSDVTWDITAKVPALNKEDTLSSFAVTDTLDPRLQYKSVAVESKTEGTDYTVTVDGQKVTVTFDASKLSVGDVKIKLTTTVKTLGTGVIENTATQFVNDPKQDHGTETNTPKTKWGDLEITKIAKGDESKTLAGAEFEVYSDAEGKNKVGTITTGSNGKASISLYVGKDSEPDNRDYWIKETKAPAGYVLDGTIKKVTVKVGETASTKYSIENTQQDHPELPLTGANGQMLAIIAGSALVLLAAGSALVVNRRRHAAQR